MSTVLTNEELTQYVGTISESLNTKVDTNMNNVGGTSGFRKLIEIYNNGTSWYKVYAEYNPSTGAFVGNWCEQGGVLSGTTGWYTITYLKSFTDNNYILTGSAVDGNTDYKSQIFGTYNKTSTGVQVINAWDGTAYNGQLSWKAEGYIN